MKKHVASKLQDNVVDINCPVSGCKVFLEPQHCASVLPKQVFDRWNDALCDTFVMENIKLVFDDDVKTVFKGECSSPQTAPLTFFCEICADEKPEIENFRVSGCVHSYCSECMGKYVASRLQDNVVDINCPVSGCKGKLEPQHCVSILPKQVFDRWSDAQCEAFFLENIKLEDDDDDDDDVKLSVLKGECSSPQTAPKTFLCEICADEKPEIENFRVSGCDHSYCSECVGKYVASKLQDNVVAISCPVSGCKGSLEPEHCVSILPKQVFDRWGDALCESLVLATEKFYCPFKDCSALLVDDTKLGKNIHEVMIAESECPHCNRLFCAQCKVPWHSGIDCAGFNKLNKDDRSREDIMLMNLAKNNKWMRCPMCNFFVEKTQGCLHMKCRCGNNFCYSCGLPNVHHFLHVCAGAINKT